MKNTFVVSMTLLLALTLGGSILGYRTATAEHEKPAAQGEANPGTLSQGGSASTQGSNTAAAAPSGQGGGEPSDTGAGTSMNDGAAGTEGTTGTAGSATAKGKTDSGTPGNTNLAGTVSSNAADGSLTPSGPNAAQKAGNPQTPQANAAAGSAEQATGDAEKGKAVFASASCAGCHGANGEGGVGPNLHTADGPKSWTLEQFQTALRQGQSPRGPLKAPMPQYTPEQLGDADVTNIYAYIKTLN